jgi:hypothetical protein
MKSKAKLPKISKQASAEIADDARKAFSNSEADRFFEEVMEATQHYNKVLTEANQQTRTE